jgi:hypothetical protein
VKSAAVAGCGGRLALNPSLIALAQEESQWSREREEFKWCGEVQALS